MKKNVHRMVTVALAFACVLLGLLAWGAQKQANSYSDQNGELEAQIEQLNAKIEDLSKYSSILDYERSVRSDDFVIESVNLLNGDDGKKSLNIKASEIKDCNKFMEYAAFLGTSLNEILKSSTFSENAELADSIIITAYDGQAALLILEPLHSTDLYSTLFKMQKTCPQKDELQKAYNSIFSKTDAENTLKTIK